MKRREHRGNTKIPSSHKSHVRQSVMICPSWLLTTVIGGRPRDRNEGDANTGAEPGRNKRILRARQPRGSPTTKTESHNEASQVLTRPCPGLMGRAQEKKTHQNPTCFILLYRQTNGSRICPVPISPFYHRVGPFSPVFNLQDA